MPPALAAMIEPSAVTRQLLEPALLTAIDLAVSLAGAAAGAPWMPIDTTAPSPPALRPIGPDGEPVPMLAEAGIVLAGPRPQQAARHMIAAYAPGVAEQVLRSGEGNQLGVFGDEVAVLERLPDVCPVGEVRTTVRVVAVTGLASRVLVWRRGSLIAHVAVSGDETLATMLVGHAARVADTRLGWLLARLTGHAGPQRRPGAT